MSRQPLIEFRVVRFARQVVHAARKRFCNLIPGVIRSREFLQTFAKLIAEFFMGDRTPRDADHGELRWQPAPA
jgi:hypothetical protein